MTNNTLVCACALIFLGGWAFVESNTKNTEAAASATSELRKETPDTAAVEPKKTSLTTLIPAGVGLGLLACVTGIIFAPNARKHIMHAAAVLGLIGVIGGFVPVIRGAGFDFENIAVRTGLWMALVSAVFVGLCVKSFIDARKAREASAAAAA